MKILAHRRLGAALLGIAALVGVALGLALTRHGTESALAQGPAGVLARGKFKTVSWGTVGSASIERNGSGHVILRFSRDFNTQRAPELFVHLGRKRMRLQRAWGSQTYRLSGVDAATLHATVQVFCEKCNKAWGEAKLRPAGHRIS
ncbi:MAG: hypothetical protein QOG06_2856 [Gaiellaceae bacterium]|jgi:hypothetical protein|nr:hypothetical protein [Gaiellaceae bacterium]